MLTLYPNEADRIIEVFARHGIIPELPEIYIGASIGDLSGASLIYADVEGKALFTLHAYSTGTTPTSYQWSIECDFGECDSSYLIPNAASAEIHVSLFPQKIGGTLIITCEMYNADTSLGTAVYYLSVLPAGAMSLNMVLPQEFETF